MPQLRIQDWDPPMAIELPLAPPMHDLYRLADQRVRRCTFRRLVAVKVGAERIYEAECLFPERRVPIPLGDLETALPICNSCTAAHIFRPDED